MFFSSSAKGKNIMLSTHLFLLGLWISFLWYRLNANTTSVLKLIEVMRYELFSNEGQFRNLSVICCIFYGFQLWLRFYLLKVLEACTSQHFFRWFYLSSALGFHLEPNLFWFNHFHRFWECCPFIAIFFFSHWANSHA